MTRERERGHAHPQEDLPTVPLLTTSPLPCSHRGVIFNRPAMMKEKITCTVNTSNNQVIAITPSLKFKGCYMEWNVFVEICTTQKEASRYITHHPISSFLSPTTLLSPFSLLPLSLTTGQRLLHPHYIQGPGDQLHSVFP